MKISRYLVRIPAVLLLCFLVFLVLAWAVLKLAAAPLAADMATRLLGLETRVARLDLSLLGGRLVLGGVEMEQPSGFGPGPMFRLDRLEASFSPGSLLSGSPRFDLVCLEGAAAAMVLDREGRLNFDAAFPSEPGHDSSPAARFILAAARVSLRNGSFLWTDLSRGEAGSAPPVLKVDGIGLEAFGVGLDTIREIPVTLESGFVEMAGVGLGQPPGCGDGPMILLPRLKLELGRVDFDREVAIRKLILSGLTAAVCLDREGRLNLAEAFAGPGYPAPPIPAAPNSDSPGFLLPARVDELEVVGERFSFRNFLGRPDAGEARRRLDLGRIEISGRGLALDLSRRFPVSGSALRVAFKKLAVSQPPAFGGDPLLSLSRFEALASPLSFSQGVDITSLALNEPEFNLVIDREGRSNLGAVFATETDPSAPPGENRASPPFRLRIRRARVDGGRFRFLDWSGEEEGADLDLRVNRIRCAAGGIRVRTGLESEIDPPASFELTGEVLQEEVDPALLGVMARIGPLGTGIPVLTAVGRVVSLELVTLGDRVPDGTSKAVGGKVVDLGLDLGLTPDDVDCLLTVEAPGSIPLNLRIGGTPSALQVDTSSVLYGILVRSGGFLGQSLAGAGRLGYEIGATAVETAGEVGKGAFNIVYSLGEGLGTTLVGAATGDLSQVGRGLAQTTVGTAGEALGTVTSAGGKLIDGATNAAGAVDGTDAGNRFRSQRDARWRAVWRRARQVLEELGYPPRP